MNKSRYYAGTNWAMTLLLKDYTIAITTTVFFDLNYIQAFKQRLELEVKNVYSQVDSPESRQAREDFYRHMEEIAAQPSTVYFNLQVMLEMIKAVIVEVTVVGEGLK